MAVLDVLLGIVPGAAAGRHRNGDEQTGDDGADQQTAERLRTKHQADDDGHGNRQDRRNHHFLDRGHGQHVNRTGIVRLGRAIHDALDFLELAAHFDDHRASRTADGFHRHGGEEVGNQAADEEADDDHVIGQVEADALEAGGLQTMRVVGEEHEGGETGGTDGVALGDRLGRVADGVEGIGHIANVLGQTRHFGDAAGVVGDRTVGVESDDDAGHRQHRGGGDGDSEQAAHRVGGEDRSAYGDDRQGAGLHRDADAGDDVGRVTRLAGGGDMLHRRIFGTGVVLGDPHQRGGQQQADDRAAEHRHRRDLGRRIAGADQPRGDRIVGGEGQDAGDDQAAIERRHDLAAIGRLDEVTADDRRDDRHAAQRQRIENQILAEGRRGLDGQRRQHHRRDHGHGVGLEEVGGHAGAVADVVTDVVGDDRRVARIVFRDAGLDLAHQVGADVGALGEDAAAKTGEDGDQRGAEGQADQRFDDMMQIGGSASRPQVGVVAGDAEQAEADDQHAGDRAALEGDRECRGDAAPGGFGRTHVGPHRDVHADEAGGAGENRADQEADGGQPAELRHEPDDQEEHDTDDADGLVLTVEVGRGSLLNRFGNLLHACVASRQRENLPAGYPAVQHRNYSADKRQ